MTRLVQRLGMELDPAAIEADLRAGKALGLRTVACLFGYGDAAALRQEGADTYWSAFGRSA